MKYVPMDANERYLAFQSAPVGGTISDKISVIEQAVLARIESQGLVIVPREPTAEMIEEGAKQLANWDNDAVWPDSWLDYQVNRMRREAEKSYKAMLEAAKEST